MFLRVARLAQAAQAFYGAVGIAGRPVAGSVRELADGAEEGCAAEDAACVGHLCTLWPLLIADLGSNDRRVII